MLTAGDWNRPALFSGPGRNSLPHPTLPRQTSSPSTSSCRNLTQLQAATWQRATWHNPASNPNPPSARILQRHPSPSTVTRDKFAFPSNDVPELNAVVAIFPRNISSPLLLQEPGSQVDGESRCSRVWTLRTPKGAPSLRYLWLSFLPTLLPAPRALRPASAVPALHAPRPAPPPPTTRSGLLVPRQAPGHARARAAPARSRGAPLRGRGRASRCGLAPLSGSFPLSFSFTRPRLLQFVKDPPELVAGGLGWGEEGAL